MALVAKAQAKGDAGKLKAVDQTLKGLKAYIHERQANQECHRSCR